VDSSLGNRAPGAAYGACWGHHFLEGKGRLREKIKVLEAAGIRVAKFSSFDWGDIGNSNSVAAKARKD